MGTGLLLSILVSHRSSPLPPWHLLTSHTPMFPATQSIPLLFFQNYVGFAICYSLGSITSICSTMFLMGPVNQVKRMFDSHRIIATVVFLAAIAGTLAVAFKASRFRISLKLDHLSDLSLSFPHTQTGNALVGLSGLSRHQSIETLVHYVGCWLCLCGSASLLACITIPGKVKCVTLGRVATEEGSHRGG